MTRFAISHVLVSDMDGSLLSDLEFFPPTDKSATSVPVPGVPPNSYGPGLGIYQNEESVDLTSWILDACSEVPAVPSPRASNATPHRSYREAPNVPPGDPIFSFRNFCSPSPGPAAPSTGSNGACINMYDSETNHAEQMTAGNVISLPHSRTTITALSDHGPLVIPGSDHLVGTRPAPGKAAKKSKKKSLDRSTREYREKRERNNIAVRKSREKNRQQIMETQQRVKELEDENSALQSKITLLSKELKVLKDLFASAGVNQPPSLCVKPEPKN